jgi:hypothetical protein
MLVMREELRQLWLNTSLSREQLTGQLQAWCQRRGQRHCGTQGFLRQAARCPRLRPSLLLLPDSGKREAQAFSSSLRCPVRAGAALLYLCRRILNPGRTCRRAQLHPGATGATPALPGLQHHDLAEVIVGKAQRPDGQTQRPLLAEQFAAWFKQQRCGWPLLRLCVFG